VIGMVELFGAFTSTGHDVAQFARGISIALYNTAGGIVVAVPAMIFYRYFRGKVDSFIVDMEQEAIKLVEIIHGERQS
jgi:biopolymer transport protein ExbB